MLKISDLHVEIEGKKILKGLNLEIKPGETHAIMGPNGSGKSTLANILAGRDGYEVTKGEVIFEGKDLLDMDPEERAREGVFLAFQYPVELPGVMGSYFLRNAFNAVREHRGQEPMKPREFNQLIKEKAELLQLNEELIKRSVNEGFSGGEKKRNEIFQMAILDPKLCVLDETDSGLDIDALQIVSNGVNTLKKEDPRKSFIVVTHYQRLLNYIVPDFVHVLVDGKIVKSGDKDLALHLEEQGYSWVNDNLSA
ncbi:MAG: Fe-S cluster assembly ATPase SufC [Deltaproteobacteria bacterium]|nr:Fe-S cluster assembly ATPase SufC [Deltaproteobacteria bacterium]